MNGHDQSEKPAINAKTLIEIADSNATLNFDIKSLTKIERACCLPDNLQF